MAWYAIYDLVSGKLESIGQSEDVPAIEGKVSMPLVSRPDLGSVMWDEALRVFVARPPKVLIDRWEDIQNSTNPVIVDFRTAYGNLNTANKRRVQDFLIWLLGRYRYRNQSESVEL